MKRERDWINGAIIVIVLGAIALYAASQINGDVGPRRRGAIREIERELEQQKRAEPAR